ncbi:MAG: transglutaminase family protein [Lentisphaeria bacterium]
MRKTNINSASTVKKSHSKQQTLIELLRDGDNCVASLAMEQLLEDPLWPKIVADNQDSSDTLFRKRLHELNHIGGRRQLREQFLLLLKNKKLDLWSGLLMLDQLYDFQSAAAYLEEMTDVLVEKFRNSSHEAIADGVISFMREENFTCATKNWMDLGNYILGDVLESHCGAAVIICAITQYIAYSFGINMQVCLHAGHYCLYYERKYILDPGNAWKVDSDVKLEQYHLCSDDEVLQVILEQLFAMSIIEWDYWEIHVFMSLLCDAHHISQDKMPGPIGKYRFNQIQKS